MDTRAFGPHDKLRHMRKHDPVYDRRGGLAGLQERGAGGEIQITDAMITLQASQSFTALEYEGKSFDCGSKIGFLTANVAFALEREDLRDALLEEIRKLI